MNNNINDFNVENDDLIYIDQDDIDIKNNIKQNVEDQRQKIERLNKEVEEIISKEEIEMTLNTFRRPHSAVPSADNMVKMTSLKSKKCTPTSIMINDDNLHIKEDVWFYFH
jgi:hypothetical protein